MKWLLVPLGLFFAYIFWRVMWRGAARSWFEVQEHFKKKGEINNGKKQERIDERGIGKEGSGEPREEG